MTHKARRTHGKGDQITRHRSVLDSAVHILHYVRSLEVQLHGQKWRRRSGELGLADPRCCWYCSRAPTVATSAYYYYYE